MSWIAGNLKSVLCFLRGINGLKHLALKKSISKEEIVKNIAMCDNLLATRETLPTMIYCCVENVRDVRLAEAKKTTGNTL